MDGDVENGDVSSGNSFMYSHAVYQHNGLKPSINNNNSNDIDMDTNLNNGDVICGIY